MVDNVRMFCKALGERPHKIKANKDLFIGASKQTLFVDTQGGGYLQVGGSLLYLVKLLQTLGYCLLFEAGSNTH